MRNFSNAQQAHTVPPSALYITNIFRLYQSPREEADLVTSAFEITLSKMIETSIEVENVLCLSNFFLYQSQVWFMSIFAILKLHSFVFALFHPLLLRKQTQLHSEQQIVQNAFRIPVNSSVLDSEAEWYIPRIWKHFATEENSP